MKIVHLNTIAAACSGPPCAVALGCFDGVHIGHAKVLAAAKATGLKAVALTMRLQSGECGGKRGGHLMSETQRDEALAAAGMDAEVLMDFESIRSLSPETFAREILCARLRAKTVCCGFNYRFGKNAAAGTRELAALGEQLNFSVVMVPPVCEEGEPVSSTRIRALVSAGRMEQAERLLGRPYAIRRTVVPGQKLGRTLGTPTINQNFADGFCVPRFGVYATQALVEDAFRPAVTNVGVRPTVGSDRVLAETYIPGFSGDLYGREITVRFRLFLRPEVKFEGLEELRLQMQEDTRKALRVLENPELSVLKKTKSS